MRTYIFLLSLRSNRYFFIFGQAVVSDSGISSIDGVQSGRCPAVIVPGNDFQCVSYLMTWDEQCVEVVVTITSFSEDIQSEIYLYRRICDHIQVSFYNLQK